MRSPPRSAGRPGRSWCGASSSSRWGSTPRTSRAVELPPAAPALAYRIIDGFYGPTPQARTDGSTVVPFRSVVTAAGSAGAIASTAGDLARWARALYGGTGVLSAATRREMLTFVKAYLYGTVTSYGLGVSRVEVRRPPGVRSHGRAGGDPGRHPLLPSGEGDRGGPVQPRDVRGRRRRADPGPQHPPEAGALAVPVTRVELVANGGALTGSPGPRRGGLKAAASPASRRRPTGRSRGRAAPGAGVARAGRSPG